MLGLALTWRLVQRGLLHNHLSFTARVLAIHKVESKALVIVYMKHACVLCVHIGAGNVSPVPQH